MTFKDNLRKARTAAKLTQEQLAHAIGAAGQSRIANYEKGLREPYLSEIQALAKALRITPAELVGWNAEPLSAGAEPLPQLTTQAGTSSQLQRPTEDTLHEALDLLRFDEEKAGEYPGRARTARLLELYDRVARDGGVRLSSEANARFDDEVQARAAQRAASESLGTTSAPGSGRKRNHGNK